MSSLVDQSRASQKEFGTMNRPIFEDWTMLLPMQIGISLKTLILTLPFQHGMKHSSQLCRSSLLQRLSEQQKRKPFCEQGHRNSYKREALCSQKTQEKSISGKAGSYLVTHLLRKSERALATTLWRTALLATDSSTSHSLWKHMNDIQGKSERTIIPTLVDLVDGSPQETAHEKASLLNAFFCHQTLLPGEKNAFPDTSSLISNRYNFDSLNCTPCEVHDIIAKLKTGKPPGLDYIPPRLLRLCAPGISASVAELFDLSFRTATFPSLWKKALVVPIHKKGNLKDPGNYRPIALLPILSKVLERIVHNKLSPFLSPWLSTNQMQSGLKRKDGTVPQLMRLTQTLSDAVDEQKYVGAVFFDLK